MTVQDTDMELLERKYAMYVLMAVDEMWMPAKRDIMCRGEGGETTKFNRINELIEAGLIEMQPNTRIGHGEKGLALTDKGSRICKKVSEICRIMQTS